MTPGFAAVATGVIVSALLVSASAAAEDRLGVSPSLFHERSCAEVRERAREIMLGRQFGLSWDGARSALGIDPLSRHMVAEAYGVRRFSGNEAPFEAIDSFGAVWQDRCGTASNG